MSPLIKSHGPSGIGRLSWIKALPLQFSRKDTYPAQAQSKQVIHKADFRVIGRHPRQRRLNYRRSPLRPRSLWF